MTPTSSRRLSPPLALVLLAMVAALLAVATPPTDAAPGTAFPSALTVDQRSEPADVDNVDGPILGWQVPSARQTGYQVQVAPTHADLMSGDRLVWDSGRVTSAASTNVAYAGPRLERGERYAWRVRTWDGSGAVTPWSRTAEFGTALGGHWGDSEPIWTDTPQANRWSEYTLQATFAVTTQNASIVFNAQDPNNYLMWQFRGDGASTAPSRSSRRSRSRPTWSAGSTTGSGSRPRGRPSAPGSTVS
jgi:alpha-L-rhamnosidase